MAAKCWGIRFSTEIKMRVRLRGKYVNIAAVVAEVADAESARGEGEYKGESRTSNLSTLDLSGTRCSRTLRM